MRKIAASFLVALTCSALLAAPRDAGAQELRPERFGFSAQRLTRIEALMGEQIDANIFAGAVTLVARENEVIWFHAQGLMDVASGTAMREDAVFRIMSMTKPVVALAILMMVEEGKVRLTDPVSRFIPELGGLRVALPSTPGPVAASRDITVLDLLTHTSGLMSGGASSELRVEFGAHDSLADVLPRLAAAPLDFEPGTRWAYSAQYGFDVLVRIVEIASGVAFDKFARQRIFEPLGMKDTYFYPATGNPRVATLYQSVDGRLEQIPDMAFMNGAYFSGGGGLFSTAEDYLQFALMLLNDGALGNVRLIGSRTAQTMHTVFAPASLPGRTPGEGYGLGVRVVTDPAARRTMLSQGSFGWSGAFNTHFFIDPEKRIVGIFMTQSAFLESRQQLREDFETAVMQAIID